MVWTTVYQSPIGGLTLAGDGEHLTGLWIEGQKYFMAGLTEPAARKDDSPVFEQARQWLDRYFAGERPVPEELPLQPHGTAFQRAVWDCLCKIPWGQVTTYGMISREIARHLPPIRNDPTRFGRQLRMDDEDGVLGEESAFLAGSTDIPLAQVPKLVSAWGGAAFPSHIDRPSFSLLGVLGLWDPDLGFTAAELSHHCPPELVRRPDLAGLQLLTNSDAHYLDQVWGAEYTLDLPECSPQAVIQRLACHPPGSGQDNFLYNLN